MSDSPRKFCGARLPAPLVNRAKGYSELTGRTITDMIEEGLALVLDSIEIDVDAAIAAQCDRIRKAAQELKKVG